MRQLMTHGKMSQVSTPLITLLSINCGNCGISQLRSLPISQQRRKPLSLSQHLLDAGTRYV
jgi:hypothetical protein